MTIYSLYIYDRHCECVYYQGWHRTTPIRPGKDVLPGVAPGTRLQEAQEQQQPQNEQSEPLPLQSLHQRQLDRLGVARTPGSAVLPSARSQSLQQPTQAQERVIEPPEQKRGLPFDEECKLLYGIVYSLRSTIKKISTKEDEAFIAYKTSTYKLHLFETPSGMKFVLFSDPNVESLRFILKQIYQGSFVEFVVRNPVMEMDSRVSGRGIDSQAFRTSVNNFISGLTVFR